MTTSACFRSSLSSLYSDSLTIPGQVVVTTETGELCVHWDEGKEEVIVRGKVLDNDVCPAGPNDVPC